jgi:hypothetical protein
VIVEREGHEAQSGETDGAPLHVLVESRAFVAQQPGRAGPDPILVDRQTSDHPPAVDFVGDVADLHRGQGSQQSVVPLAPAASEVPAWCTYRLLHVVPAVPSMPKLLTFWGKRRL